jgi:hypothetical protein
MQSHNTNISILKMSRFGIEQHSFEGGGACWLCIVDSVNLCRSFVQSNQNVTASSYHWHARESEKKNHNDVQPSCRTFVRAFLKAVYTVVAFQDVRRQRSSCDMGRRILKRRMGQGRRSREQQHTHHDQSGSKVSQSATYVQ